jgi:hypothetical protein
MAREPRRIKPDFAMPEIAASRHVRSSQLATGQTIGSTGDALQVREKVGGKFEIQRRSTFGHATYDG